MKNISLNRILIITLIIAFLGITGAYADNAEQEENNGQNNPSELYLNNINIVDIFCQNNPNQVFIILDQYDKIITQGKCGDVMVKFFLTISDPLLQIDNIKYFRLGYENPEIMQQRLVLYENPEIMEQKLVLVD